MISTQFADIFKGNAYNNGILPIELEERYIQSINNQLLLDPSTEILIDLESQLVAIPVLNFMGDFEINPLKKQFLMEGIDETDFLIKMRSEIAAFEKARI